MMRYDNVDFVDEQFKKELVSEIDILFRENQRLITLGHVWEYQLNAQRMATLNHVLRIFNKHLVTGARR